MRIYLVDGTFVGLLTAIFDRYDRKQSGVRIIARQIYTPGLLDEPYDVVSDDQKAKRVWKGLGIRLDKDWLSRFYAAFLGEQQAGFQHLFDLACYVFDCGGEVTANYGNSHVLYIAQLNRKVHREKHRMEAFVRFQKLGDGTFFALVAPDYNVLPLVRSHFKNRYADQRWTIYDQRRAYGIHYDGCEVSEVEIDFLDDVAKPQGGLPIHLLAEDEELYQRLWKGYFQHTNIPSRKNTTLHIRHVPKRYWRYLTEKADLFTP